MVTKIEDLIPEDRRLKFNVIAQKFEDLQETYINKFDREFPSQYDNAKEIFLLFAHIAKNTYKAIRCLSIDVNPPHWLKPEYAISATPMIRMLLEELATIVYFSDDVNKKCNQYRRAGWREKRERYDKYEGKYGNLDKWKDWLSGMGNYLDSVKSSVGITSDEESDLSKIAWWPTIVKMSKDKRLPQDLQDYIGYLIDWFYKEYSQSAHLTEPGIIHMGAMFLFDDEEDKNEVAKKFRSDGMMDCILLCLAILSEFEIIFDYNQKERLNYLWKILVEYHPKASELYKIRYGGSL